MNVSTFENGKLTSPYLGVESMLDGSKKTNELNKRAYSVLICLAVCDVNFNERTERNLNDEFDGLIMECDGDNDFVKVKNMLEEAASNGGYAVTFLQSVREKLNAEYQAKVKSKKIVDLNNKKAPVSYISEAGKLISPYFDITYRPTGYKNFKLDIACSSMIMSLSMCDAKRDDETQVRLLNDFCKVMKACKEEEEFLMVKMFLDEFVKLGGYAVELNEQVRSLISLDNMPAIENIHNTVMEQLKQYGDVVEAPVASVPVQQTVQPAAIPAPVGPVTPEVTSVAPTPVAPQPIEMPQVAATPVQQEVAPQPVEAPIESLESLDTTTPSVDPLVQDFNESYAKFNECLEAHKVNPQGDVEVLLRNGRRLQDQLLDISGKISKEEFNRLDDELDQKIREIRKMMTN